MHLVNNEWTEGLGDVFVSTNPFNDKTVWSGKVASSDQIDQIFLSAKNALKKWRKLSLEERCDILSRYAENIKINQETFAEIISQETGKPFWESKTEVNAMVNKIGISIKSYRERTGNKVTNANGTELKLFQFFSTIYQGLSDVYPLMCSLLPFAACLIIPNLSSFSFLEY